MSLRDESGRAGDRWALSPMRLEIEASGVRAGQCGRANRMGRGKPVTLWDGNRWMDQDRLDKVK